MFDIIRPHDFPPGRYVELPGRGRTFVRELAGPPGAPTLVLLHGWTATGALNWSIAMGDLSKRYNVVTIDHRGHGRGLRSSQRFSLEACADDVAAMMSELGIRNALVAGYSMGGPISQLLARRHPGKVAGLIECSTAARFPHTVPVAIPLSVVSRGLAVWEAVRSRKLLPPFARRTLRQWLPVAAEVGPHDTRVLAQCGPALSRFDSRQWLPALNVPAASVITTKDQLVAPILQRELAALLGATVYKARSLTGHFAAGFSRSWVEALVSACVDVEQRAPAVARDWTVRSAPATRSAPRPARRSPGAEIA